MTGIQAPELKDYSRRSRRGECMAVEAAETLDNFIHNGTVRLVALRNTVGGGKRGRLRRCLQVKRGGKWIDPAMVMLRRASCSGPERRGVGLERRLQPDGRRGRGPRCRHLESGGVRQAGPVTGQPDQHEARSWDGEGKDTANSEWVRITNHDPVNPVPLGWLAHA